MAVSVYPTLRLGSPGVGGSVWALMEGTLRNMPHNVPCVKAEGEGPPEFAVTREAK